jgi:hypothetical protein
MEQGGGVMSRFVCQLNDGGNINILAERLVDKYGTRE